MDRVKPHGCWNKIILEKPFEHPHFLRNKLSHGGKKKFDFERIIPIPAYMDRSNTNVSSSNNWTHFRNKHWGCTWNPKEDKIEQKIRGESLGSKFWTTDLPIGILLKLKLDDSKLKISGHSKTYLKDEEGFVKTNSWGRIDWEIINQYSTEQLWEIRYQILESFDEENKLLDIDILLKHKDKVKEKEVNTLEQFFLNPLSRGVNNGKVGIL